MGNSEPFDTAVNDIADASGRKKTWILEVELRY